MSEDEKFEEKDLGKERSRAEGDHFETRVPESEYYRLVVENQRLLVEINRVETENKDLLVTTCLETKGLDAKYRRRSIYG